MKHRVLGGLHSLRSLAPGSALAVVVALAASFVSQLHGGPQMLYALFFGVAFHYLSKEQRTKPGIEFCSRHVLRLGVGLLGARITAMQIAGLGWVTAITVVAAVISTLVCGLLLARRLGLTRAQGVLPRDKHHDRFTLMVVITVTVLSTVAMVAYPLISRALGLSPQLAGLFIGGTIHDVAQVVGAGYTLGTEAGDSATIVKLFRVSMLALVVLVVSLAFKTAREQAAAADPASPSSGKQALVPWFLWLFAAMVLANSAGTISPALQQGLGWTSRACLVVAIAALGMKTSFMQLAQAGWRPIVLITIETLWMAALVLAVICWQR